MFNSDIVNIPAHELPSAVLRSVNDREMKNKEKLEWKNMISQYLFLKEEI